MLFSTAKWLEDVSPASMQFNFQKVYFIPTELKLHFTEQTLLILDFKCWFSGMSVPLTNKLRWRA